jgi:hypothetical protein
MRTPLLSPAPTDSWGPESTWPHVTFTEAWEGLTAADLATGLPSTMGVRRWRRWWLRRALAAAAPCVDEWRRCARRTHHSRPQQDVGRGAPSSRWCGGAEARDGEEKKGEQCGLPARARASVSSAMAARAGRREGEKPHGLYLLVDGKRMRAWSGDICGKMERGAARRWRWSSRCRWQWHPRCCGTCGYSCSAWGGSVRRSEWSWTERGVFGPVLKARAGPPSATRPVSPAYSLSAVGMAHGSGYG